MELCPVWSQLGHIFWGQWLIAFNTDFEALDRIIAHVKLSFIADRPSLSQVFEQVALMAAEGTGEYE